MGKTHYITTTLPYVNADPHIGTALEFVQADILARHLRLSGDEVFFNTGTDEHGLKIYRRAQEEGKDPQKYVDEYAARFGKLKGALNLSYDNFIRTTDPHHVKAAQEFWKRSLANGDIYKKTYKGLYCVGDELFITDKDLVNGRCPNHPNQEPIEFEEENYFFAFSKYQKPLLELYKKNPDFVVPKHRFNEIKKFVESGLEDFSISRVKEKMPWGVPVPDDEEQVMYVWFDALINYVSAIGWPDEMEKFEKWWPVIQFAGKDQTRQQAAMWQAMLLSSGITPSKQIVIHGFVISGGQKMSKSLGNIVDPFALVHEYGTDAVRYYLARHIHPFEDSDFTPEKFKEAYNANLANGLGNLVSRVMKMAEEYLDTPVTIIDETFDEVAKGEHAHFINNFEFNRAMDVIWNRIQELDQYIQKEQPFIKVKADPEGATNDIVYLVSGLMGIAHMLTPFLPDTADKIKVAVQKNRKPESLFVRKQ